MIEGEVFFGQIKPSLEQLTIQKTLLGWIVSGKCMTMLSRTNVCHVSNHIRDEDSVNSVVQKFSELESLSNISNWLTACTTFSAIYDHFKHAK